MFVYPVYEENHGLLTIAKDYKNAIHFLIDKKWLTSMTETWNEEKNNWDTVEHCLGPDWAHIMLEDWTRGRFNDFWWDGFWIDRQEVFEKTS